MATVAEVVPKILGSVDSHEAAAKLFEQSATKVDTTTPPVEAPKDPNTQNPQEKKPELKKETTPVENKEKISEKSAEVKPKLRERIKGKFFEPETPAEPEKEKINVSEIQNKLSEYEKQLADPDYKAWKAIKEKGKKSIDILKEVAGLDESKMSDEEVFRHDLKKAGITDPDAIAFEIDTFFGDGTSARVRKKEIDALREGIRKESENTQSEFFNKLTAPDKELAERQRIEDERLQADVISFDKTVTSMIGQEIYGIKVTKDMANILTKTIEQNELIPKKDDGSLDTKGLSEMLFLYKFKDLILDEIEKTAYANGVHEIADEVEATPASSAINGRPPEIQTQIKKGSEQEAKQISESLQPFNPYQ